MTLPPETFRPAENGVQTGILFLRKKGGDHPPPDSVFRAVVKSVGYDHRERPIYRTVDGRRELVEDVSAVIASWRTANEANKWF